MSCSRSARARASVGIAVRPTRPPLRSERRASGRWDDLRPGTAGGTPLQASGGGERDLERTPEPLRGTAAVLTEAPRHGRLSLPAGVPRADRAETAMGQLRIIKGIPVARGLALGRVHVVRARPKV